MTNALYVYGGWPGHRPYDIAEWTRDLVGELGFDLDESQDIFTLDRDLSGYDLIILGWNNALTTEDLSDSQEDHLLAADRVAGLVLIGTGPGFRNPEARGQWNERAEARARELEAKGLAESGGGAETRLGRHRSAQGLAGAARGMLAQHDSSLIDSLPRIAVPTLVLVGAEDRHFLAAADYMAAKIPGAQKAAIPGAGHAANLDQPELFNRAVAEFLTGLPE